ncbi:hypothetical protein BDP27DRAFT_1399013 [Rhodocollybia butyracea]|uniref:Uncharacterized protein n=1 Tax=Rhodocollybia butyracea TaxID=206335 RepID=A0A9P5UDF2_9AGAR|nr:hypothetical protein BDP27DRAFT_1399013 [Rhodocollybia butyracea]
MHHFQAMYDFPAISRLSHLSPPPHALNPESAKQVVTRHPVQTLQAGSRTPRIKTDAISDDTECGRGNKEICEDDSYMEVNDEFDVCVPPSWYYKILCFCSMFIEAIVSGSTPDGLDEGNILGHEVTGRIATDTLTALLMFQKSPWARYLFNKVRSNVKDLNVLKLVFIL